MMVKFLLLLCSPLFHICFFKSSLLRKKGPTKLCLHSARLFKFHKSCFIGREENAFMFLFTADYSLNKILIGFTFSFIMDLVKTYLPLCEAIGLGSPLVSKVRCHPEAPCHPTQSSAHPRCPAALPDMWHSCSSCPALLKSYSFFTDARPYKSIFCHHGPFTCLFSKKASMTSPGKKHSSSSDPTVLYLSLLGSPGCSDQ